MTTNLLIGYPQITTNATITSEEDFDDNYPVTNLIDGARGTLARTEIEAAVQEVIFDAGSSTARTIDFFYVARAGILKAQGSKRCGLTSSVDNVTYSDIAFSSSSFQSKTLRGPDSDDLIWTNEINEYDTGSLPDTTAARYYKFHLAGSGTCPSKKYMCSKVMFGSWFDFEHDPEFNGEEPIIRDGARRPAKMLSFTWRGISATIKNSAIATLFEYPERGVILYTKNYHGILNGYRVFHCYIASYSISVNTNNTYNINIKFIEMI